MNATDDRIVGDYLARLDAALAGLPGERRREIVEDVAEHIDAAREEIDPGDEAALRTALDRIGDPEQIAADAGGDQAPQQGRGRLETAAIVLLLAGGFLFVAGWLVGVVLLWLSDRWRVRDKVIGTLFVPGGLALPILLLTLGVVGGSSEGEICTEVNSSAASNGSATTAEHCKHYSSGPHTWHVIGWSALLLALTAASIGAAVHLARRSR